MKESAPHVGELLGSPKPIGDVRVQVSNAMMRFRVRVGLGLGLGLVMQCVASNIYKSKAYKTTL